MGRWKGADHPTLSQIRVKCETCGEQGVDARDITVIRYQGGTLAQYRFRCPDCGQISMRNIEFARTINLLLKCPVSILHVDFPPELDERHDHPPITADDILDAHLELEQR